jgi:hypothetical protein
MSVSETEHGIFDPGEIVQPTLAALHGFWLANHKHGVPPGRADIDPSKIVPLLPIVMLVDVAERIEDYSFRLFGTGLVQEFGEDRTGRRFGDLLHVENAHHVMERFRLVVQNRTPDYETSRLVSTERPHRAYARLLLPLSTDKSRVDMVLGGIAYFRSFDRTSLGPSKRHPAPWPRALD